MKIFVSIATYNERENIEKLLQEIFALPLEDLSVVVVDDNSPDGTAEVVEGLKQRFAKLFLVKREGKLGYGSAHISGFKFALDRGAEAVVSLDADFSHEPQKIPELIAALQAGYEVAVGSRRVPGGRVVGWSFWRHLASGGAMIFSKIILGIKTHDLTSGFRAYSRQALIDFDWPKITSNGYSFLEEIIYRLEKQGFKVKEVPIVFADRKFGRSKLSRREIVKFFLTVFRIKFLKNK